MHSDKISAAINALLDKEAETIPEEYRTLLAYLFGTKEGKFAFQEWVIGQNVNSEFADVDMDRIYLKVQQHVDISDVKGREKVRKFSIVSILQRAAAFLLLPMLLLSTFLIFQNRSVKQQLQASGTFLKVDEQQMEYYSPAGARLKVILPDSTEVWLNGNSRLALSKTFGINSRTVNLHGQAFFHVKHNELSPFIVNAGSLNIKALGTSFNVFAYPEESRVEAVLISGKIAVNRSDGKQREFGEEVMLKPNQKISFSKETEQVKVENVYSEPYQSWTKGKLIFNDDSIEKVANVLEHYYNVKIVITDPRLLSYRFTATVEDCSIEQMLEYLQYSSPIQYVISRNNIMISMK